MNFLYYLFITDLKWKNHEFWHFCLLIIFSILFWFFFLFLVPSKYEITPIIFNIGILLNIVLIIYFNVLTIFKLDIKILNDELLYLAPLDYSYIILIKFLTNYIKFHLFFQLVICIFLYYLQLINISDLIIYLYVYNLLYFVTIIFFQLLYKIPNSSLLLLSCIFFVSTPLIFNIQRYLLNANINILTFLNLTKNLSLLFCIFFLLIQLSKHLYVKYFRIF